MTVFPTDWISFNNKYIIIKFLNGVKLGISPLGRHLFSTCTEGRMIKNDLLCSLNVCFSLIALFYDKK